jgi:nitroimidazol reductase NimA-like FMN-containing flavoprotein (pyridoxamine 5'-phosphate oxidase superfamily)
MRTDLPALPPPRRDRPQLPPGYGLPADDAGLLEWRDVEARLAASKHYWLSSVRPDCRPHSMPRWGVWLDGRFWYDGSPETRHARNAEQNPAVTLTLESGKEAVVVEGESHATRASADGLGARLADAFRKYHDDGYAPGPDSWAGDDGGGLRVITPSRVLAWFSFPKDVTRFRW